MTPLLKYRLKRLAGAAGVRARPARPQRRSLREFCLHLRAMGHRPDTIVDVGVADGTFDIYTVFPDAHYLLVEPLIEFMPPMQWIAAHYNAAIVVAAAGAVEGHIDIRFGDGLDVMHGATTVPYVAQPSRANGHLNGHALARQVPMRRIDALLASNDSGGSILLKVDTQGSELDVVRGASGVLDRVDVIVLETSLFNFEQAQPELVEAIDFMSAQGYVPYDMFDGYNRPLDNALGQVDIAFVRRDGPFRQDARYAAGAADRGAYQELIRRVRRRLNA